MVEQTTMNQLHNCLAVLEQYSRIADRRTTDGQSW